MTLPTKPARWVVDLNMYPSYEANMSSYEPTRVEVEDVDGLNHLHELLRIYAPELYGFIRFEAPLALGWFSLVNRALKVFGLPMESVVAMGWDRNSYTVEALVETPQYGEVILNRFYDRHN